MTIKIIFWLSLLVIFYSYIGYGILLWMILKVKKVFKKQLLCFVEGSVFTTNQNFIGSYVPEEKQPFTVYHNAVGFMI